MDRKYQSSKATANNSISLISNEEKPLVSVILPAYNVASFLKRCVKSLLAQTYQNLEILIVDDCSPDESGKIADDLASTDSRIAVFHHACNLGYSGARNTGLNHAHGEYVTFVDSDDWVEPDYVEYLMNIINDTHADIAMSRNFYTSRFRQQVSQDSICIITPEDMLCDIFYNRIHVGVWNRLYKRSLIGEKRFSLDAKTGEGMQFNTQVIPCAKCIGVGLRRIYTYNVDNNNSATKKPNIDKQAYGAIATMDSIGISLQPRSKRLDNAYAYQYFTTALYALTHLLRAKACHDNRTFQLQLIHSIREIAPHTLHMEISVTQKIKSIAAWISPMLTVRLAVIWRYGFGIKQRV